MSYTKRYIVPNDPPNKPPDEAQLKKAIQFSLDICKQHNINKITLFIESKIRFPDDVMQSVLGYDFCRQLKKNTDGYIPFEAMEINLHSLNTITKPWVSCELLLAYNPYNSMLDCLNDVESKVIVVIPFNIESISSWYVIWPIHILIGDKVQSPYTPLTIPLFEEAMIRIRRLEGNRTMSILDSAILCMMKNMFNDLHSKQIYPTKQQIRQSAIRNGWKTKHARALGDKFGLR